VREIRPNDGGFRDFQHAMNMAAIARRAAKTQRYCDNLTRAGMKDARFLFGLVCFASFRARCEEFKAHPMLTSSGRVPPI